MREYIKLCRQTHEAGIDFLDTNKHSGDGSAALVVQPFNISYLYEKLECIYGPTITKTLQAMLETEAKEKRPRSHHQRQPQTA